MLLTTYLGRWTGGLEWFSESPAHWQGSLIVVMSWPGCASPVFRYGTSATGQSSLDCEAVKLAVASKKDLRGIAQRGIVNYTTRLLASDTAADLPRQTDDMKRCLVEA